MSAQLVAFPRPFTPPPAPIVEPVRPAHSWRGADILLSRLVEGCGDLDLDDRRRWMSWACAPAGVVVRDLLARLGLPPEQVGVRQLEGMKPLTFGDLAFTGPAMGYRDGPLAIVGRGLSLAEAQDVLEGLARACWRPDGRTILIRS